LTVGKYGEYCLVSSRDGMSEKGLSSSTMLIAQRV